DSITKAVSSEMNFGQVMLVRGLFAIVLIGLLAFHQRALRPMRTLLVRPVALRVIGEVVGTVSFLAAIVHLPLANTTAIFQALPLVITLGAALLFGEPVGWRRWLAITAGFIGYQCVIMALRTGDISAVAPFRYSALLWAMLLGYLVFGDRPDAMMVTGASVIVLSGLYAFYREHLRHRSVAASSSGMPPEGV